MKYFPAFLDLALKKCVVVGGGKIAERKIGLLLKAGALVTVISPDLTPALTRLAASHKIIHKARRYKRGDTQSAFLVVAATGDEQVDRKISLQSPGLVNAVDMPEYCSFIVPSIISNGDLTIAVSTSGASPALARTLRREIETILPDEISKYLSYLASVRKRIRKLIPGASKEAVRNRSALLKEFGSPDFLLNLHQGGFKTVKKKIEYILKEISGRQTK